MSRKKLRRFAELKTLPNVFTRESVTRQPDWLTDFFETDAPVILELGCGKGEYSLALARRYADRNILGVDRKGERIWKGAKAALEAGIWNLAFLRARIEELEEYLKGVRVEQIWMPFPDPLPKKRQIKHRMVSPSFLDQFARILEPGGTFHIKTDDPDFLNYAVEMVQSRGARIMKVIDDVHALENVPELLSIRTTYEQRHLDAGKTIKYLSFQLR